MSRLGQAIEAWFFPDRAKVRKVFDREFYLRTNPDVAAARVDPLKHYLAHGAAEQRQPHPLFDPAHYLAACAGARVAKNPLLHFIETRRRPWPAAHPLFDCEAYASAHPEVTENPLVACVTRRAEEPALEGSQFGQC
jgi:hypothetical protein